MVFLWTVYEVGQSVGQYHSWSVILRKYHSSPVLWWLVISGHSRVGKIQVTDQGGEWKIRERDDNSQIGEAHILALPTLTNTILLEVDGCMMIPLTKSLLGSFWKKWVKNLTNRQKNLPLHILLHFNSLLKILMSTLFESWWRIFRYGFFYEQYMKWVSRLVNIIVDMLFWEKITLFLFLGIVR